MKKITILLVAVLSAFSFQAFCQEAPELKYYDVKECGFPLVNHGFDNAVCYYGRLDAALESQVRPQVWDLAKNDAGVAIRFRTNARTIGAKWTLITNFRMNHMAPTGICGCDLYGYDGKEWRYVGTARPNGKESTAVFRTNIDGKMREYCLYLPLYDGVTSISIGVSPDAVIEKPAKIGNNPFGGNAEKPIVFFGHSGCQGGCASRPGMVYTSILGRKLKRECINLGFSGFGQMYTIMAREMNKIDAGAYVLDCLGNNYLKMTRDSSEVFIRTLADAHPDTPVYMLSSYASVSNWVGYDEESETQMKNDYWRQLCFKLNTMGYKNIHFIDMNDDGTSAGPDGEGTVDGGHPTDLGFMRIADFLYPHFKKLK